MIKGLRELSIPVYLQRRKVGMMVTWKGRNMVATTEAKRIFRPLHRIRPMAKPTKEAEKRSPMVAKTTRMMEFFQKAGMGIWGVLKILT